MKKVLLFVLIFSIVCLVIPTVALGESGESPYILEADKLKALGLFIGTDIGYELERTPNRAEAGVMLVRLLGKEAEALGNSYSHPFKDVPEWVDRYVGYLYEKGLTKGISGDLYDPYAPVDAKTYLTFLLRALGFTEDDGDFNWAEAVGYSYELGLLSGREMDNLESIDFNRGLMAALSYNAVNFTLKGSEFTLAKSLVEQNFISLKTIVAENFNMSITNERKYLTNLINGEYAPYVVGLDKETALIKLRKTGVETIEFVYLHDEIIPEDTVISQDYHAYIDIPVNFSCVLTLSKGPTLTYHDDLLEICVNKGWPEEIIPYIISASKYLIKTTILSKYEVYYRLKHYISDIKILSHENSAGMGYGAIYETTDMNLYINRYILDEKLILHELVHAMSNSPSTGKIGFHEIGNNTRVLTEAFSEYISTVFSRDDAGPLNYFRFENEEIVFSSDSYFSNDESNFALGVFSPLFIVAGKNTIEKMYFQSINQYSREVLGFNEKYGERMWETLWTLADSFIDDIDYLSEEERIKMELIYSRYLDGIINCLETDFELTGENKSRLIIYFNKLQKIKGSLPLGFSDYREKLRLLEEETALLLQIFEIETVTANSGYWIVPDYSGKQQENVFNNLTIMGEASGIGYRVVDSEVEEGYSAGILYINPLNPREHAVEIEQGDKLKLGGEYIILIPGKTDIPTDYVLMRDFKTDFGKYLADYSNMDSYIVGKLLESEGIQFRYKFTYFDYVAPAMQGRIVGQFPPPDSALIPGETTVIIYMLKERQR